MIDYIKLRINSQKVADNLLKNALLAFHKEVNSDGCITKYKANFSGLNFFIDNGCVRISGSLHKYWNMTTSEVNHNFNDFNFLSLKQTIHGLCNHFSFEPNQAVLECLEIGVNIELRFQPEMILGKIISYKFNSAFAKMAHTKGAANAISVNQGNCRIKIYDKGLQYHVPNVHLLRFERKSLRSRDFQKSTISTLNDLMSSANLQVLGDWLLETWDNVLLHEKVSDIATPNEKHFYNFEANNPKYWQDLTPRMRYKKKKRYEQITYNTHKNPLKTEVRELVAKKWQGLNYPRSVDVVHT